MQISSEHSVLLFQKSCISSLCDISCPLHEALYAHSILMILFYLHICLIFLPNTKALCLDRRVDRSEHNSWEKPNTLNLCSFIVWALHFLGKYYVNHTLIIVLNGCLFSWIFRRRVICISVPNSNHLLRLPLISKHAQICPSAVKWRYRNAFPFCFHPVKWVWPSTRRFFWTICPYPLSVT